MNLTRKKMVAKKREQLYMAEIYDWFNYFDSYMYA